MAWLPCGLEAPEIKAQRLDREQDGLVVKALACDLGDLGLASAVPQVAWVIFVKSLHLLADTAVFLVRLVCFDWKLGGAGTVSHEVCVQHGTVGAHPPWGSCEQST